MLAILALLEGPFGKLIMYAIGALVAICVVFGVYFGWKHKVQQEELMQFNAKQAAQTAKDNEKFTAQQKVIEDKVSTIESDLKTKNEALQKNLDSINIYLANPATKQQNRPASPIIKETIRRLQ